MMTVFGIILGCIGQDPQSGTPRFVFGLPEFLDGIGLAPFVMGLFGISEVFFNIEEIAKERLFFETKIKGLLPSWQDWKDSIRAILRGSVLGFMLGVLPGGGALIASFASYAIEKKVSKHPEKFGKGAIEGVAGPESANNAAAEGAFVPMFTLGIPPNVVMALLLGALMIHGITPGPFLIPNHPEIFWGVVASMYVGNLFLLVLNVPLIGVWVQLLKVPYVILFPLILLFCLIGAYSINNSTLDITVMLIFGGFGYLMRKFEFEAAPMVLGFVLGPMLENNLRLSLILSGGSFSIFFSRPIAAGGMIISFFLVISCFVPIFGKKRRKIPIEEV
jgi:putative tricarboxylic transport membrane protein